MILYLLSVLISFLTFWWFFKIAKLSIEFDNYKLKYVPMGIPLWGFLLGIFFAFAPIFNLIMVFVLLITAMVNMIIREIPIKVVFGELTEKIINFFNQKI